jgi:hypothetical protein
MHCIESKSACQNTNTVLLLYISSLPPSFQGLWSKIIELINNVTLQCLFGKQSVYTIQYTPLFLFYYTKHFVIFV